MATLAILIACHNRREKTLACLEAIYAQEVVCEIYLIDDGSTDGTSEALKALYPKVHLFKGDGSLFWVGGMRLAFSEALKVGYDYYLWLNDDTWLDKGALAHLLDTHHRLAKEGYPTSIVVGSTRDRVTGELTYGGLQRSSRWHPLKFKRIEPSDRPQLCLTMNGNCVLIPHAVVEKVGILDPAFIHRTADYDYGLRATKLGCSVWVASGYVGSCARNAVGGTWEDASLPLKERWKRVVSPKGLSPREWKVFAQRYAGHFWYFYWLLPYIRIISSSSIAQMGFRQKQQPKNDSL